MPEHALQILIENDVKPAGTGTPARPAAASQSRRFVEERSLRNDLRPVLRQDPGAARQVGKCPDRRQVVAKIDDPSITHPVYQTHMQREWSSQRRAIRVTRPACALFEMAPTHRPWSLVFLADWR
jgi:hypothetical protein